MRAQAGVQSPNQSGNRFKFQISGDFKMAGVPGKSGRKANEQVIRQNLVIVLDEIDPATERKRMLNVIHKLVENAENGDMTAINAIMDRVDGKPKQQTEVSGPDGGAINIRDATDLTDAELAAIAAAGRD